MTLFIRKIRPKFIAKCVRFFMKICDSFVAKHNRYCKTRRFYYKMWELLQNAIFITKRVGTKLDLKIKEEFSLRPKKVVLFPEIAWMKIFSSFTHPHRRMCIRIYVFCFKQKTHTQTKSKKKNLKKTEKQKKPKKKRRNKMLLLTISVENLTRYHDIVWEFTLRTFTYVISQQRES